jgi:citrate synthase
MTRPPARTDLCYFNETDIFVRDRNLCTELIGKASFTSYLFYLIMGEEASDTQVRVVDAALVSLAEHGLSPGATVTRLTYMGAPESLQGAVAAGLLGVGDQFAGTLELTGPLLAEIVDHPDGYDVAAKEIVARYRTAGRLIPGFGQPHHKPDDPRSPALFALAEEVGLKGDHIRALKTLGRYVDESFGRHLTINGPAAISALFLEIGIPLEIMRGFAVICRAAGLVAHIREEQTAPVGRALWEAAASSIAYPPIPPVSAKP